MASSLTTHAASDNDMLLAAPERLLPAGSRRAIPLFDRQASTALEQAAARALPPHTLMQRAGTVTARLAMALVPHAQTFEVLAGPGNNGGDGFEAALQLRRAGRKARVWWVAAAHEPDDAQASRLAAQQAGVPITKLDATSAASLIQRLCAADRRTVLIDALLGRGTPRAIAGWLADCIAALNHSAAPTLSVDLPSGLPGDTGDPVGTSVVRARWTLALLRPAPGLFTGIGRDQAGEVWLHDLGVAHALEAQAPGAGACADLERGTALDRVLPPRQHLQHKGSFGDVRVVGGAHSMTGAAWLAARAALNCGAGRAHVHALDVMASGLDTGHPELMPGSILTPALLTHATVVAGCGGGSAIAARLPMLLRHAARLVLDADALNAIAADAALDHCLRERSTRGQPTVLTPHPLEAARLLSTTTAAVQADRLKAARTLAQRWDVITVLKGSGSVITDPHQRPSINASGSAALATAGSGDVLAGCIGALWSRHAAAAESSKQRDPNWLTARHAAEAACFLHGRAAEAASPNAEALPASQLIDAIGACVRDPARR